MTQQKRVCDRPLKIGLVAPPWFSLPPKGYGGIETVVAMHSDELARRGHDVHLFCPPGSQSAATVRPVLEEEHTTGISRPPWEADHVARVFEAVESDAQPFDVIHDHSGFTALTMADRIAVPVVHTLHYQVDPRMARFYARHQGKAALVALSDAQLRCGAGECRRYEAADGAPVRLQASVIPNGLDVANWPLRTSKENYLLWIGRVEEGKGPHRAIEVARRAGMPLVLAGPVHKGRERFYETKVKPLVDGVRVTYVGEVGGEDKKRLFSHARALLMPIRWCEPFGMVLIEALACGTPVIGFPEGAATEIIVHGQNGFLVEDGEQMAQAVGWVSAIDPEACRASVADRFSLDRVVSSYEALYRKLIGGDTSD